MFRHCTCLSWPVGISCGKLACSPGGRYEEAPDGGHAALGPGARVLVAVQPDFVPRVIGRCGEELLVRAIIVLERTHGFVDKPSVLEREEEELENELFA